MNQVRTPHTHTPSSFRANILFTTNHNFSVFKEKSTQLGPQTYSKMFCISTPRLIKAP